MYLGTERECTAFQLKRDPSTRRGPLARSASPPTGVTTAPSPNPGLWQRASGPAGFYWMAAGTVSDWIGLTRIA